jgi:phosphoribosyl-AMP cyclohydrolase
VDPPIEQTDRLAPRYDAAGLVTAVVQDARSGEVLMVAHMDAEALTRTRETGLAHFHSRSRGRLWLKGETSGNTLRVLELRVDCDQDAILLRVEPSGPACHTGAQSCFYRSVGRNRLERIAP